MVFLIIILVEEGTKSLVGRKRDGPKKIPH
jgi:hypothetical protein